MAFALSVRGFDFTTQYTYAYSKQVGLQTNGPWELKKDYVELKLVDKFIQYQLDVKLMKCYG
jgi:hypothetical protein